MSFYTKIRGTLESIFQIGIGGPQIKRSGAVIEMRNATDSAYAITRGLDPVGANDYVTKNHFDVNNAAATGLTYIKLPLGTSTVVSTGTIPNNAIIRDAVLDIETAYDGSTTWSITRTGDGTKNPIAAGDNDPATASEYHVPQILDWGSTGAGTVTATRGGTPTVGAATLYIGYVTPISIA